MMKKTLLLSLLLIVLAFGVFAAGEAESDEGDDITVAGVVFQEDQFMRLVQLGYEQAAQDAGVEVLLANTNGDQAREVQLVNTYVAQGLDGIAITPLSETSSIMTLKEAYDAGVEIAISNMELKDASFVVGGYTSDQYGFCKPTGEVAREFIQNNLDGEVQVAVLMADSQVPEMSEARFRGFFDQIEDLPGVELVARQDAWIADAAFTVAGDIITANPDLDIIWGVNEGATIGATLAVQNAGKAGEIFVFGTDANEQLVNMLKDPSNILQAVTGQDPYMMGYQTMETLIRAIRGENVESSRGQTFIVDGVLLTRDDPEALDAFLEDLQAKMQ